MNQQTYDCVKNVVENETGNTVSTVKWVESRPLGHTLYSAFSIVAKRPGHQGYWCIWANSDFLIINKGCCKDVSTALFIGVSVIADIEL